MALLIKEAAMDGRQFNSQLIEILAYSNFADYIDVISAV
jgi:hypothetical protein